MTEHPLSGTPGAAAEVARELVTTMVTRGVRDVVLAPGSRSAPLAYAVLAAHRAGWLELHVRIDERVAGFMALGLARGTGRAVAVVTTSGTAVANLHPAVLEAAHAGVPLLLLTADRPHEMRQTGANQTADQVGIFGPAPRWTADIPAGARPGPGLRQVLTRALAVAEGRRGDAPGPVHVNVGFREPLAPGDDWRLGAPPDRVDVVPRPAPPAARILPRGRRTVVVAGDGAGPEARTLAEAGGWPLLAEPTSGVRAGANAVIAYRALLDEPGLGRDIERVVVMGHPTLTRPVSRLLARRDVEVVVVSPSGTWTDVAGTASLVVPAVSVEPAVRGELAARVEPKGNGGDAWLHRWQAAGAAADGAVEEWLQNGRLDGLSVARLVAEASAAGGGSAGPATLVLGSSNTVRDVDLMAPTDTLPTRTVANRGLAGIDGTVSTATGLALATGEPVRAVMGDLTFLHDAGGLLRGELERDVDLQVVVVNDRGGGIFATLEHGEPARAEFFERIFGTPQAADLAHLAAGYGAGFTRVSTTAELRAALAAPIRGRSVVEVVVDRTNLRAERLAVVERVRQAVRA